MSLFELTKSLMNIPSVSGNEEAVGYFLRDHLETLGWTVELQPVSENQNNVIATLNDTPRVWLSTHMDTVPPFIPPTEDNEKIYGRGACDAKGIIAAQITAAEQLRKEGITDIGLLYTVEEERASTGAKAANLHPLAAKCEYMINGEPTDNDLAIGSKGSFRLMIKTSGKAAHSAYPEEGDSAIETLLDILEDIRHTHFPHDDFFGETTVNIGTIDGGLALNIIPPKAEAGLLIRLTTKREPIEQALESVIRGRAEIEVLSCSEPVKLFPVEGFTQKVVRFTTDIPHMSNWGKPLLLGPGSILVAHTKDEFVLKKDLEISVEFYINLAKKLLATNYTNVTNQAV
ncbi:MAG TPA: peptidase dimerization protein [Blastocatellia bacterium]|nr:M20/M25/M40 family metallo-hydrolase [Chloracidobacterium sp.]HBE81542.1 peptidase dimerization protein [Blastocatellia bacterium]